MDKEQLQSAHPDVTLLEQENLPGIRTYLQERAWIRTDEELIRVEKAGEGNMNLALRVFTGRRTFIIKQSRPWVEKYPHIAAPWDRVIREARFYELIKDFPEVAGSMPGLIGIDPLSRVMACEDLGEAGDFTDIYGDKSLSVEEIDSLATWLSALHRLNFEPNVRSGLTNRDMRLLNHEHIFRLTLERENGLDLDAITSGLQAVADKLINDSAYVAKVRDLGKFYLADGPTLLHGDYFPGSWLRTMAGLRIIDPEFCFFGGAEFDTGVNLAHLHLSNQSSQSIERFQQSYRPPDAFASELALSLAGVEIMRRIIGVAQLPLPYGVEKKSELLKTSRQLVLYPEKTSWARPHAARE